jgi:predicted nucleic acid-binding protein
MKVFFDTSALVTAVVNQLPNHGAALGLRSGAIYDALHVRCAERAGCDRILTYNTAHFARFTPPGIEVATP